MEEMRRMSAREFLKYGFLQGFIAGKLHMPAHHVPLFGAYGFCVVEENLLK